MKGPKPQPPGGPKVRKPATVRKTAVKRGPVKRSAATARRG
jgi:hypothetical protein